MCTNCNAQPNLSRRGLFQRARQLVAVAPLPEPVEKAPGLEIYPREAWAGTDRPPTGELYPESVYFLVVHHSATANGYTEAEALTQIQDMYDEDTSSRGWPDVTYNFFIDRFGRIFEGRAGSLRGPVLNDAVGGNTGWSQQVCLLGEFSTDTPSIEALDALTRVMSWLADRHELDIGPDATATVESRGSDKFPEGEEFTVNTITGHRDVSQTECPGDAFYPYVSGELPTIVAAYRTEAATSTSAPSTTDVGSTTPTSPSTSTSDAPTGSTTSPTDSTATTTSPSTTTPTSVGTLPTDTQPVTVGSAGSSAVGSLLTGMGSGIGVVAVATGIGWLIQRRRANGL